jgi:hypothetical protein
MWQQLKPCDHVKLLKMLSTHRGLPPLVSIHGSLNTPRAMNLCRQLMQQPACLPAWRCRWPAEVTGSWQGAVPLEGRVRLATRALFFDPDDVRVPIVRLPFCSTHELKPGPATGFTLAATAATKMLANMEEVPYTWHKGAQVRGAVCPRGGHASMQHPENQLVTSFPLDLAFFLNVSRSSTPPGARPTAMSSVSVRPALSLSCPDWHSHRPLPGSSYC